MIKVRVLILSVGTGHGHNQVGNAIMGMLESYQDIQCTKLDTFKYISPVLGSSLAEGYLVATKYTPSFYGKFYGMAERRKPGETLSFFRTLNSILAIKLTGFLEDFKPDVTVCTHVFAAQMVTMLKNKELAGMTLGIVTDFTIHPYWEETKLDYYITPSEKLNSQAVQKAIPLEKVKPLGIPIHEKFAKRLDKLAARESLDICNKTTVLVIGGSMGYGNIVEIIQQLDMSNLDFQILCICGNNTALKHKIDTLGTRKKLYSYGFVNNIDVMMDASDCIITKPGGLTVSESLSKGIPMILVNPIPGQEERNAQFLIENGAAIASDSSFTADEAIEAVLTDRSKLEEMLKNIAHISRPYASRDVCGLIQSHSSL